MKNRPLLLIILYFLFFSNARIYANEPDSAYIFAYATEKNHHQNGLHFSWSIDKKTWFPIGPEFAFVKSDYSRWGTEKKMISPILHQSKDGNWHAVWTLNETDGTFAYAFSEDLVNWKPQSYPIITEGRNCLQTELSYTDGQYTISWISVDESDTAYYAVKTKDFKTYSKAKQITKSERLNQRESILVSNKQETGTIHHVPWMVIEGLEKKVALTSYRNQLFDEKTIDDPIRFADLKSLDVTLTIDIQNSKKISDKLLGIFFEDINYAADGGIYAELIRNRDFEFSSADYREWNAKTAWYVSGESSDVEFYIDTVNPIHPNNLHYAYLHLRKTEADITLVNEGWDGIVLEKGEKYDFSFFAAASTEKMKRFALIQLVGQDGKIIAEKPIKLDNEKWKKYTTVLTALDSAKDAILKIKLTEPGWYKFDMVSLFPQKTFKNRKNGLRADLAQTLADMKPQFVRFPGGCVAHGDGIGNIYHWKHTIGALEARKPQRNLWGYHQTAGLGYFEYFQFCEDIGAEPIPIVAAGVPCQNSAKHGCLIGGQQGGIPLDEMSNYIQDILDLVEWANGDPKTSKWAKMRADAGHPKPFNLKYIGVGNEDLISDVFEERFEMIFKALKEKYPEITIIGTAGPFSEGSDYVRGWEFATELDVPMLDEHYYQPPGWFIYNQDFYDRYDRNKAKVYLGEYAAHLPGRPNNIETALAEAIYLISCERNGDVVEMTSYAPLLAKEKYTQWNPDLIYFNNSEIKPTVGYYVQQLFGQNAGTEYIASYLDVETNNEKVRSRIACSVVKDAETNDIIIKLVNLLPAKTNVNINKLNPVYKEAIKIVLSGKPDGASACPVEDKVSLDEIQHLELPAYSFTVLRIK